MSKRDLPKKPTTPEEFIARGGFQVSKMQPGVTALIESTVGTMYTLRMADPFQNIVEFYATCPILRNRKPIRVVFVESWMHQDGKQLSIPDWVVKDGRMILQFRDTRYTSDPVQSVLLEGPGWKYEVIKP